jgi:hypothetical protein
VVVLADDIRSFLRCVREMAGLRWLARSRDELQTTNPNPGQLVSNASRQPGKPDNNNHPPRPPPVHKMSATTPLPTSASRPGSRPGSRPTTPLRRSNLHAGIRQVSSDSFPLNALEPQFAELGDEMATLEANFADLREMHDSISRFNENFAAFLYGLNLNAYCVDFPEAPVGAESFARVAKKEAESARESEGEALFGFAGAAAPRSREYDAETTFM